jgi:DNA-binding beta-propeller fold protein YncE
VIDAEGYLRRIFNGDDMLRQLDNLVNDLLEQATAMDIRNFSRVRGASRPEPRSTLKFPTSILAARDMLYVADCANNRVLEMSESGRVVRVFGSGNPGFWDGVLENAGFNLPRDLVIFENYLYLADTGNHAIRRINLFNGEIETMVGNGKAGKMVVRDSHELREVTLVSPVSLALHGPELYISNAGMHQIWKLDLKNNSIGWFAGTGQATMADGRPIESGFLHPMGMAVCEPNLYVADADASAIRELRMDTGMTSTCVGVGEFTFGDEDGTQAKALMQYPMDVAVDAKGKQLWVADSFNNKLRTFDLKSRNLLTPDIDYEFSEPFGLCMDGNVLWVANTNAHEIVKVDTITKQCHALEITESRH